MLAFNIQVQTLFSAGDNSSSSGFEPSKSMLITDLGYTDQKNGPIVMSLMSTF